jgi:hypothetical protein
VTEKARGDKKGSGRQQEGLHKNIFNTASTRAKGALNYSQDPLVPIVRLNFSVKITGDEDISFWLLWGKKPWG